MFIKSWAKCWKANDKDVNDDTSFGEDKCPIKKFSVCVSNSEKILDGDCVAYIIPMLYFAPSLANL